MLTSNFHETPEFLGRRAYDDARESAPPVVDDAPRVRRLVQDLDPVVTLADLDETVDAMRGLLRGDMSAYVRLTTPPERSKP
jgi:hypothetical protein